MLSDKITTPNKAGTLKGVSPISSSRNVMAKVKDTASFIEAARAVHGDKYDYSQTVWTKANDPISFKCNCCGRVITNSGARKHIFGQQSGCGKCYRKPTALKQELELLKNRKCKICGNKINSINRHKVTCSADCGRKAVMVDRVEVNCCSCGKAFEKRVTQIRENNCCSSECQIEWALKTNQGGPKADWLIRSKNAKSKWIKRRRTERLKKSSYVEWNRHANRQFKALLAEKTSEWMQRCISSSSGLSQRLFLSGAKKRRKPIKTFEELCSVAIVARIDYSSMEEWSRKCYSAQKNMKWKRRLRNVKRHTLKPTEREEQPAMQLTLWELLETPHQVN
jgi:hypothetical protein